MEHESFEDQEVARLMNEAFISVKVDREERPDLDNIYMTVCQMVTGSGGWPLTIIMTPDKKPFFAGTYFPKESRLGTAAILVMHLPGQCLSPASTSGDRKTHTGPHSLGAGFINSY